MFKIAIVEDQEETRESLNRFVRQYAQEQGLQVEISLITDGAEIAEHYTPGFDIIFMDVEMPRLDGFGAAEAIRIENGSITPTYIQYLWVRQQSDLSDKTVIYVPTETNLPILESTRMLNQAQKP